MKSIKEKAKEYDIVVERTSPNKSIVDTSGRKQFEAGANYVLEQVEMLLNSQKFVDDPSQELYELIEQLKKK